MKTRIIIHSKITSKKIHDKINKFKNSPWSSTPRTEWEGYILKHKTYKHGRITLRIEGKLKASNKLYATAIGNDRIRLTGSFLEWILNYFPVYTKRISITSS